MGNCSSTSNCNPCGPDFSAINQLATKAGAYARQANTYSVDAQNAWLEFNALYLGSFDTAPTSDNEGNPLQEGALYFNSVSNQMFVWQGASWIDFDFDEFTPFLATGTTFARNLVTRSADVINVKDFGAVGDGVTDDGPAFRLARDYVESNGGGVIYVPSGEYMFSSSESKEIRLITSTGGQVQTVRSAILFLTENVSLIGAGSSSTKIKTTLTNLYSVVITANWKNAGISGFEIEGAGDQISQHGIFNSPLTSFSFVMENVYFNDLYIHNVGAYGLGNDLQCKNVNVEKIRTSQTGADGIDWKVRGASSIDGMVTENINFNDIVVRGFGVKIGAGTPTGIGFRGKIKASNIEVYGASPTKTGIDFVAGIAVPASGDYRLSTSRSSITNWYVEGEDPKTNNVGLQVWAAEAVAVGTGVAKWCNVTTSAAATTPYGFQDNGTLANVVVIPSHGWRGFHCRAEGTALNGCRVISDKAYFDSKRNNLIAGQTVFNLPWSTSTSNAAPVYVVKNNNILTIAVDYTVQPNSITLTVPVIATDSIVVVMPPFQGYRVEAEYCSFFSCRQDRYVPVPVNFQLQAHVDTSNVLAFQWDGNKGITEVNNQTIVGLVSSDASVTDKNLLLCAKGAGTLIAGLSTNKVGFYGSSGATRPTVTGSRGGNAALASLLTSLDSLNLIEDSTTA